jgi:Na+/citrate or Na+/malate symporter
MTLGSVRSSVPQSGNTDDFSLVLGGPFFQLFLRARLTGDALELVRRRIVIISLFAWMPLLILSIVTGVVAGSAVKVPFLYDIETHVRLLVALPLLSSGSLSAAPISSRWPISRTVLKSCAACAPCRSPGTPCFSL